MRKGGLPCCNEEADDDEGNGIFGFVLASLSLAIILLFLPFSLCTCLKVAHFDFCIILPCFCFQVVQEYERAVIFRFELGIMLRTIEL